MARVGVDPRLLLVDVLQVGEADRRQSRDRLQVAHTAACAPAERAGQVPLGKRRSGRQQGLDTLEKLFGAGEKARKLPEWVAHRTVYFAG